MEENYFWFGLPDWIIRAILHRLSGDRKPLLDHLNSATGSLHESSSFVKPASHRWSGKGLTNEDNPSTYHPSRIKTVSGIRNTGFQIAGIKVSLDKNIHLTFCFTILGMANKPLPKGSKSILYLAWIIHGIIELSEIAAGCQKIELLPNRMSYLP